MRLAHLLERSSPAWLQQRPNSMAQMAIAVRELLTHMPIQWARDQLFSRKNGPLTFKLRGELTQDEDHTLILSYSLRYSNFAGSSPLLGREI